MAMPALDAEKLKENALTSIRLGIEDFQRSRLSLEQNGDPARALSAIRNLFAGVLLLFKYKIATSVDDPEVPPPSSLTHLRCYPKPMAMAELNGSPLGSSNARPSMWPR